MALTRTERRQRIRNRVRKTVTGTAQRPRLAVFRSNKGIYAQLIDDVAGVTLMASSSLEKDFKADGPKTTVSVQVGKNLAEKAIKAGIENVCFDRAGYLYHGRVKALAEGAREAGLKF